MAKTVGSCHLMFVCLMEMSWIYVFDVLCVLFFLFSSCPRSEFCFFVNLQGQVDFDDKSSWEYLFKDYYLELKRRLSLTKEELTRAVNLLKGRDGLVGKQESLEAHHDSENSDGDTGVTVPKRRQSKRQAKSHTVGRGLPTRLDLVGSRKASLDDKSEWASKELVEFVMHMRNGDRSILSQYDVQALLLEYIKRNKLRDPKRKSQIICDQRLQNLFGKPRVGHFEMLKLLESHYFMKDDADDLQGIDVDTDANQSEVDVNFDLQKGGRDKRRKARKKGDQRGLQSNLDDYAAIDTHNINLMYLRRNLSEDLIEDAETFHDKVVGSFVRIRISGSNQKQDLYRLVPVVGKMMSFIYTFVVYNLRTNANGLTNFLPG